MLLHHRQFIPFLSIVFVHLSCLEIERHVVSAVSERKEDTNEFDDVDDVIVLALFRRSSVINMILLLFIMILLLFLDVQFEFVM